MMKFLIVFLLLDHFFALPQINLHFTNHESDLTNEIQYDCLRIIDADDHLNLQIISYCVTEARSEDVSIHSSLFSFAELAKRNITSKDLYLWSAPIDIVEDYQSFLHQSSASSTKLFWNCTLPRFGSTCQYELIDYRENHSSLHEIIREYYKSNEYTPLELTCYIHLKCHRGASPSCLDWAEICDGKIDCSNDGIDEKYCWELEMNECEENEYRCINGQCIPKSFYRDDRHTPDCLDQSDEYENRTDVRKRCSTNAPLFGCEEIACLEIPITSSCILEREKILIEALYSVQDKSVSDECWSTVQCVTSMPDPASFSCYFICKDQLHIAEIEEYCSDVTLIPAVPVLFHDIYFAYTKNDAKQMDCNTRLFPYICYKHSRYDHFFINSSKVMFNHMSCYRSSVHLPKVDRTEYSWSDEHLKVTYQTLRKYHLTSNYPAAVCNRSSMYQCLESIKCISIFRLLDGIDDCPYNDDEDSMRINRLNRLESIKKYHFRCQVSDKSIPRSFIGNGRCDCEPITPSWCEDEQLALSYVKKHVSFHTICNGFTELSPILTNGKHETDETNCEQWTCDNIYTSCDGLSNCPNGIDEVGCYSFPSWNCSANEHFCILLHTNRTVCLPVEKTNDGHVDCTGATDEPQLCYKTDSIHYFNNFYCVNSTDMPCIDFYDICDGWTTCPYGDDELSCRQPRNVIFGESVCFEAYELNRSIAEQFLCQQLEYRQQMEKSYFNLDSAHNPSVTRAFHERYTNYPSLPPLQPLFPKQTYCHRGFRVKVGPNSTKLKCLCPPSFYGSRCQYQNQRISVSLRFRTSSHSWQTPFAIVILLIDDTHQRTIHSHEQFTYLSTRDCQMKFNIYLTYSTRPKHLNRNYSIHIDIYEKQLLTHRASVLRTINYRFLPVHRLAFVIDVPQKSRFDDSRSDDRCGDHGKYLQYFNDPDNTTFCQCQPGWTGRYCTIRHDCSCSSDALCIGTTARNRSVCVCPLHRFGPRCLLINTICSSSVIPLCKNGGECVPNDEDMDSNRPYTCICPQGFMGKRCKIMENRLMLSFTKEICLPQSVFVHFIQVISNDQPRRATTFQFIPFKQQSVIIHWPHPFHLVFIEFLQEKKQYYLASLENNYVSSTTINKTVNASNRCRPIDELFDQSIVQLHRLRRIKYYQSPCQDSKSNLSCFYDEISLCLCQTHKNYRVANCFDFDHNMTFDCFGQSGCENGAQCFQDSGTCPRRSICVCPPCYYGRLCQFSTSGFSVSLDAILGYYIQPHVGMIDQPAIVQFSVAITIITVIGGLINGIFSLITFNRKNICNVGCGLYLLGSSITGLVITVVLGLKLLIFISMQMGSIASQSFLSFQCHSMDFLLHCCLNMGQWLTACVAIERAVTVIKGAAFNKKKSKKTAKIGIIIVISFVIITNIHDSIYRRLINDENEYGKRTWCIVSYSSEMKIYNYAINIFHFITPFLCNLVAATIIITKKSRRRCVAQTALTYKTILRQNIREQKHLFIAPVVLIVLAVPQLIILFLWECMKSSNDSWLFLVGYFISLIPPMITFVIFILPSKFYRNECFITVGRYRKKMRGHFHDIYNILPARPSRRIHPL